MLLTTTKQLFKLKLFHSEGKTVSIRSFDDLMKISATGLEFSATSYEEKAIKTSYSGKLGPT